MDSHPVAHRPPAPPPGVNGDLDVIAPGPAPPPGRTLMQGTTKSESSARARIAFMTLLRCSRHTRGALTIKTRVPIKP
jgi:hypothetical protein